MPHQFTQPTTLRPVSVQLHSQDDIKSGLDQDVCIRTLHFRSHLVSLHGGVFKKTGIPHWIVDFQALNTSTHAIREANHTQPQFHQARSVPLGFLMPVMGTIAYLFENTPYNIHNTMGRYHCSTVPQVYCLSVHAVIRWNCKWHSHENSVWMKLYSARQHKRN